MLLENLIPVVLIVILFNGLYILYGINILLVTALALIVNYLVLINVKLYKLLWK